MRHFRRYWRAFAWITVAIYVVQTVGIAAHNAAFAHEHVFGHAAPISHIHADDEHHHNDVETNSDHDQHDHSEREAPHSDENCQHWLAWLTASSGTPATKLAVAVPLSAPTRLKAQPQLFRLWANDSSPFDARGPPHFPFV